MGIIKKIAATSLLLASMSSQALLLTATPLESESEAKAIYEPVAELLSDALGVEVTFEYAVDWLNFSKKIIASDYDLILSEPHIVAYVTSNTSILSMDAGAKLPGDVKFHVVVDADNSASNLKSLQSSSICMLPSPNFSGVLIMKEFTNPVIQPVVREVHGDFNQVYETFKKKRCNAAVIDDKSYQRLLTAEEPIKSVHETRVSPNIGLALSQRIQRADRKMIVDALTSASTQERLSKLFARHSSGQGPFKEADNDTYKGLNILPGVVWGW